MHPALWALYYQTAALNVESSNHDLNTSLMLQFVTFSGQSKATTPSSVSSQVFGIFVLHAFVMFHVNVITRIICFVIFPPL